MPEIKHNFTGGKMNKDLDERLVPNGEYRDAMNIQVATSEESEVGTVQNILGNENIQIENLTFETGEALTIGSITDEKNDTLYWFVWTIDVDYIFSYKKTNTTADIIFRDVNKNVLKFNPNYIITGINIIDDMLFWTDNQTEPKKINIPRCKTGTIQNSSIHTKLINDSQGIILSSNIDIEEKHITIIKKTPAAPLEMKLVTIRDPDLIYTGVTNIYPTGNDPNAPGYNFSGLKVGDTTWPEVVEGVDGLGNVVSLGPGSLEGNNGLTGWPRASVSGWNPTQLAPIRVGTKVVLKPFDDDGTPPGLPVTDYVLKGIMVDPYDQIPSINTIPGPPPKLKIKIVSIDGSPPQVQSPATLLKYVIDLWDETEKLFEFKFPRFSYRYKYEDGEYSPFAPFTQVAFSPGSFDYHPRKGYNLGMTNRLKQVELGKFIHNNISKDIVSIDILFKDEPSPNIYVVDTIKPDDNPLVIGNLNTWDSIKAGGYYILDNETINSVLPSNQLLRPWDNVPRRALAQDVTGNRIVYGNYVQNYNLTTLIDTKYIAGFINSWSVFLDPLTEAGKSIKSLREYQLGVVFTDKYGRETPVISNPTGTIKLEKNRADFNNRLKVQLQGQDVPVDLTHFKFFVKETANEYYNMAMDRWYNAEDGNLWLAFPSSDRSKVDIDSFLILKKGSDQSTLVKDAARYKVIAIENNPPDFIKTNKVLISKQTHNSSTNPLFPSSTSSVPLRGELDIQLEYAQYHGTSGQNLDKLEDDLYIEFGKAGSDEVSNRYRISEITNDRDPTIAGGVYSKASVDALYSLQLDKPLGDDVDFISNNTTGQLSNNIANGAIVNIYKYKVENKPQFDGRFFVKIYYDDVFKTNISKPTNVVTPKYRVNDSRVIYSMRNDNTTLHTTNVNYFLTNGNHSSEKYDTELLGSVGNTWNISKWYGHYDNPDFASFALYFRKYQTKGIELAWNGLIKDIPLHLTPESDLLSSTSNYLGKGWKSVDDGKEYGVEAMKNATVPQSDALCGYTANFYQPLAYHYKRPDLAAYEVVASLSEDNPKDTAVWFIDGGPYIAHRSSDYDLYWDTINYDGNVFGAGLSPSSNDWSMKLSYGGIQPGENWAVTSNPPKAVSNTEGFFNIGDWNSNGELVNSQYDSTGTKEWVNGIDAGNQFRWKQDPTGTIYTIDGVGSGSGEGQNLRHSWKNDPYVLNSFGNMIASSAEPGNLMSFNFTKSWNVVVTPALAWNPYTLGKIVNGMEIKIPADTFFSLTATGTSIGQDLKICVKDITDGTNRLHVGMALEKYFVCGGNNCASPVEAALNTTTHLGTTANEFLVIRHMVDQGAYWELWLGGYEKPMKDGINGDGAHRMANTPAAYPVAGENYTFVQVGMNGYSDNSEFNINKMGVDRGSVGKVGAVGYTLEFLAEEFEENILSENPAIWETEPKDNIDLDIYYEATGAIPINIDASNIQDAIPIGSTINGEKVTGYNSTDLTFATNITQAFVDQILTVILTPVFSITTNDLKVIRPDGLEFNVKLDISWIIELSNAGTLLTSLNFIKIDTFLYNSSFKLPWHNCYSFGNGVESNRIRDNFNLPYIANGVKASTTLEQEYKEEHRKYGLIYSGLYNSMSGVNNLNQFIQAEKITKEINPIHGSIQKLHSRDEDLVTLCEDKCLRILANKDAIYNADGNPQLTATENVLGQTVPFSGEFGISTNPESFASESYRVYFADKVRGAVLRLSKDGLTPISSYGMKDWFRDNLKLLPRIIGSYDDQKGEYNITLKQTGGDPTTVEILAELPSTISCDTCVNETAISQVFEGSVCPEGWVLTGTPPCKPTIPASWNCFGNEASMFGETGNCVDLGTGQGPYTTLAECQAACGISGWKCIGPVSGGTCIEVFDGTGVYSSLSHCQLACGGTPK